MDTGIPDNNPSNLEDEKKPVFFHEGYKKERELRFKK